MKLSENVTDIIVDSGACESIIPISSFPHTYVSYNHEYGNKYKACGGET